MNDMIITKDIVVSSRVRFARNLAYTNFPIRINDINDALSVITKIFDVLNKRGGFICHLMSNLSKINAEVLMEKHLISKELIDNKDISAYAINNDESIVIMINEEDHIRAQCVEKGFHLIRAFKSLSKLDDYLIGNLDIAYDKNFGFLTSCPTNVGTGMRASVMLFLPALTMGGAIEGIIETVSKVGLTVRGVYGEGSKAEGYLYQISNQISLGLSEDDIIKNVENAVLKLCEMENEARDILLQTKKDEIKNNAYRSFGILSNSYIINSSEFMKLISQVKLGKSLGLIDLKDESVLDEIEISSQSANLMERYGKELTAKERDKFRADYLFKTLKNQRI